MSNPATAVSAAPATSAAKKSMSADTKKRIGAVVALVVFLGGGYFGYQSYFYVSTDNAQVGARSTLLSPKISGIVVRSFVEENQKVKAGQVLVEIKPDDYQNAVDQIDSEMQSLAAQLKGAKSNYGRTLDLFKKGASTQERLDAAEAQYRALENKLKSAQAQVNEAKLNLDYTRIIAPVDGKVGKKSFEVGMLASAGQPLMGFVANDERWVTANLKETDMDDITEGKKAYVTVDAISGRVFEGVVESISPATGATFSLLPPDNATGNFTKVVQRVPVRIKLLNLSERDIDRLQSGLSADVKIRVH
ncbi:MAG: HlyD family secretion protein [Oligoflexia bacterium]|nr:HlyD family secretion protein [Oligoflexia bacterium]